MIFTESVRTATSLATHRDFNAAIEVLGDLWPGIGGEPPRGGESDLDYAHLLLVCGILTMEVGRFRGLPVQATAKDLLSKAVRLFGEEPDRLMALYWLGWSYVFCGENREALLIADSILGDQTSDSDIVFRAGRLKGLAHLNLGNSSQAEAAFASVSVLLETVPLLSQGMFYLNRGMLFRQTGRFEEGLSDHRRACDLFRVAGSPRLEASALNNISVVYAEQGRLAEAHQAAKTALSVFVRLRDRAHEAKVLDQLARIYEREENFPEMVRCADSAVEILSAGDHEGWLAEALITQGTARARLGMVEAQSALMRAMEICERQGDPKQAEAVTKTMWDIVRRGKESLDTMREAVSPLERAVYQRVLAKHAGHFTPAARELGLHHNVFLKRLINRFSDLLPRHAARRRHKPQMKIR